MNCELIIAPPTPSFFSPLNPHHEDVIEQTFTVTFLTMIVNFLTLIYSLKARLIQEKAISTLHLEENLCTLLHTLGLSFCYSIIANIFAAQLLLFGTEFILTLITGLMVILLSSLSNQKLHSLVPYPCSRHYPLLSSSTSPSFFPLGLFFRGPIQAHYLHRLNVHGKVDLQVVLHHLPNLPDPVPSIVHLKSEASMAMLMGELDFTSVSLSLT